MNANLPLGLKERLAAEYKEEDLQQIMRGFCAERVASFRANTLLKSAEEVSSALLKANIPFARPPFLQGAFLAERGEYSKITALPMYERGEIYFQSLSSMLPPILLEPKAGEHILDMCAAPGGKTCQMSALSKGAALITACEKDKTRFLRLSFNVQRQGAKGVALLNEDARYLSEFFRFDKILLDAPCSSSGTLSLKSKVNFSEKTLSYCLKIQQELLLKAFSLLKEGGELVYSTCSVLKEENEEQILNLKKRVNFKIMPGLPFSAKNFRKEEGMTTILPDENFEGFFVAKLKKL